VSCILAIRGLEKVKALEMKRAADADKSNAFLSIKGFGGTDEATARVTLIDNRTRMIKIQTEMVRLAESMAADNVRSATPNLSDDECVTLNRRHTTHTNALDAMRKNLYEVLHPGNLGAVILSNTADTSPIHIDWFIGI